MYKILGTDKKEYGPVSAKMLRQWIADRRVNAETLIQADGSTEWRPLSAFPEFADAARVSPPPSTPIPPAPAPSSFAAPSTPPKTSAMAITSLILGILGLISCGITAVVGLILGIVSLIKVRNSNGQLSGTGIAIAGICVSGVLMMLALPISAGLLLPALAKAKARAQQIQCMSNLKQVGLAANVWANNHGGAFPPDLLSLSNELASPKLLVCPGEQLRDRAQATAWSDLSLIGSSYDYNGARVDPTKPQSVLITCPIHNNVGLVDGSVQLRNPSGSSQPPQPIRK